MGMGVLNIKYKRFFKLFFFVVIFFVLLGLCATTKTYAAKAKTYAVKNVFPSCSTGGKIGYTDVETGDTGVVTIPVAWAKKPPTTEKTAGTTWNAYRKEQTINITKAVDKKIGNLKIHIDKQQIKTVNCTSIPGTGVSSKNYLYAVIPIDVTMPAGYFFNMNYSKTGSGGALFQYSTSSKGIGSETTPVKHCFRTTKNEEHVCRSYLLLNVQYLGLITDVKGDSYNSGDAMLKVAKYTNYCTYEMQLMPYEIEYNPGDYSDADTQSSFSDKTYISKDTKLRNATYKRKHYHQIGWKGYSQYAIVNATSATQGKHREEYSLNETVTAPWSSDGILRKKHRGKGENAGCEGIDETTESKIVLEPKWEADSFTIKYDPNGGKLKPGVTEADCTQKVECDKWYAVRGYEPYFENPYGIFRGWSTDPTGTEIFQPGGYWGGEGGIDAENNGNITLYAIYDTEFFIDLYAKDINNVTLGRFSDGDSRKRVEYKFGDMLTSIDSSLIPELKGYRFDGFYTMPGDVEGKGDDYEQMIFDSKGNAVDTNIRTGKINIKNGQLLSGKQEYVNLYAKYTKITNASCSEDSATIPNIPVNPPSDSDGPASENLHLKILKKDRNTEELLDGAVFSLQGTGDNSDFSVERTTVYGVANFDLSNAKAGEYKLTETKAPDGYKTSDSSCPWTFTLEVNTVTDSKGVKHETRRIKGIKDKNGEKVNTPTITDDSYNCTIYNTSKKQTLKITKKDSKTGEPLTGAVFRLTGPNGYNEERHVDISGVVKFEDLEPGDYELKETTVPVGYILSGKIYAVKVTENDVTITEK